MQLRTILQKLTQRGLLAPESATYISSLPPATPIVQQLQAGLPQQPSPPLQPSMPSHAQQAHTQQTLAAHQAHKALAVSFASASAMVSAPSTASPQTMSTDLSQLTTSLTSALGADQLPGGQLSSRMPNLPSGVHLSSLDRSMTNDSLQAHLDALEAGLAPLSSQPGHHDSGSPSPNDGMCSHNSVDTAANSSAIAVSDLRGGASLDLPADLRSSVDLHGDEALELFADSQQFDHRQAAGYDQRQQPYPVSASGVLPMEA